MYIYKMKLHDRIKLKETLYVLRVPGGWIYETRYKFGKDVIKINTVFVPYVSESNDLIKCKLVKK